MIKVDKLSKHFGAAKAVDNISFEVSEGETLVLLGTSGCGKTTTLKMLNRLIEPDSGSIFINGENIKDKPPETLRQNIGYVLQNNGLFPHYTVAENIAVVPQLLKWDTEKIIVRIHQLLNKLHLNNTFLNKYPHQLSGGQQQRVGLARALAANPPVLLMDEPFGALDNVTRAKIQTEFKHLDELKRKTIVMVTHDVQEAFELGNRIAIMDKGVIVQHDTPAGLLYNPVNSFVADFLKEHRLQLEFKTVKLADVWDSLSAAAHTVNNDGIDYHQSVWYAMECFKYNQATNIQVINTLDNKAKTITIEQLTAAFYTYKLQTT